VCARLCGCLRVCVCGFPPFFLDVFKFYVCFCVFRMFLRFCVLVLFFLVSGMFLRFLCFLVLFFGFLCVFSVLYFGSFFVLSVFFLVFWCFGSFFGFLSFEISHLVRSLIEALILTSKGHCFILAADQLIAFLI